MIARDDANVTTEQGEADPAMSAAPVLVTGAAGYIGSILARRLLGRGYRVRVLDRLMYGDDAIRDILSHPRLEMVVADFRDPMIASRAVRGVRAIVHLGAIVGDPACAIDEDFTIGTGDYLYLPRDVVHTFRNTYDEEARVISVVSPAGLEAYYQALADLPPGPRDIGTMKRIMADFGLVLQLPPGVR